MPHIAGFRGVLHDGEREPVRSIYRYHQRFAGPGRTFERKSLVVAVALSPYSEGVIRPHELTVEADREAALAALRIELERTERHLDRRRARADRREAMGRPVVRALLAGPRRPHALAIEQEHDLRRLLVDLCRQPTVADFDRRWKVGSTTNREHQDSGAHAP